MRIIFVRHGHPDYAHDCLTELGRKHAAAAALRLHDEGIEAIYSSTHGRAMETASHLAEALHLPVTGCEFMREINWGSVDGEPLFADGHPWDTADRMVAQGESLMNPDWQNSETFRRNRVVQCVEKVAAGTEAWLETLGYTREGLYYRAGKDTKRTIAAFGHGGASTAILAHLFNLPFPFVTSTMGPDYTGITIVELPDVEGALVKPRLEMLNDARHIRGLTVENYFGK